jgi:hypothetical protein
MTIICVGKFEGQRAGAGKTRNELENRYADGWWGDNMNMTTES